MAYLLSLVTVPHTVSVKIPNMHVRVSSIHVTCTGFHIKAPAYKNTQIKGHAAFLAVYFD